MKHGIVSLFIVLFAAAGCGYNSVRSVPSDDLADGAIAEDVATADGSMEMDAGVEVDASESDGGGADTDVVDPCVVPDPAALIVRGISRPDLGCWDDNVLLGQTDVEIMALEFTASGDYVTVEELLFPIFSYMDRPEIVDTVRNIRMVDEEGTELAQTSYLEIPAHIPIARLTPYLVVSNDAPRRVTIIADIALGGASGVQYVPSLFADDLVFGRASIRARSAECGTYLDSEHVMIAPEDPDHLIWGYGSGVLRTNLIARFADDSPFGRAAPNVEQIIGVFEIENTPNAGTFPAIVRAMVFEIWAWMELAPGRLLRVYRDSLHAANEIARQAMPTGRFEGMIQFTDDEFVDFEVASGATRRVVVTLDTSDARTLDSVTIGFGATPPPETFGLSWSDGITESFAGCYEPERRTISY